MADRGTRTEKPTPRRIEKARREGQFLSSREFVGAVQFVAFVALLGVFAERWLIDTKTTTMFVLSRAFRRSLTAPEFVQLGGDALARLLWPLGIGAALIAALGLLAQFGTTNFGFSLQKLKPSFNKLNPISRLKELPSRNVPATIQAVLMTAIFGSAIWLLLEENLDTLLAVALMHRDLGLRLVGHSILDLSWKAAGVFVLFGAVDLVRQHRRYRRDLGMSKRDIREELKESEGDPQIRARIRRLRRDMLRQQMMKQVPKATAVIVNPTHYAVALKYDHGSTAVPVVVAKGRNYTAKRIRELALAHQVPLVENAPLAQALYMSVKVGQEIPQHLYRAVAEVLAYIYRLMMKSQPR